MKTRLSIEIKRPFRLLEDIWCVINKNNEDLSQKYEDENYVEVTLDDILGFINCQKILFPYALQNIDARIDDNKLIVNEVNTSNGYKEHILSVVTT